jgi:hypothetical protein
VINFKRYISEKCSTCNVNPDELKPGDEVVNSNPHCKHFKSKGTVTKVSKIKEKDNTVGNKVKYKIKNKSRNFKPGEEVEKTEIQLKKK